MGQKGQFAYNNSKLLFVHSTQIAIKRTHIFINNINIVINVNGNLDVVNGNLDAVNGNIGPGYGNLGAKEKQQVAVFISILLFLSKTANCWVIFIKCPLCLRR